jgi:hypothetical protein
MNYNDQLNSIEIYINYVGALLRSRKKCMFININLHNLNTKVDSTNFHKAFYVITNRVAKKGFYLANETGKVNDIGDFSVVRFYYRRPLKGIPIGCTCPANLEGDLRYLPYAASITPHTKLEERDVLEKHSRPCKDIDGDRLMAILVMAASTPKCNSR